MQDPPAGDWGHGSDPDPPLDAPLDLPDVEEMEEFMATFIDQDALFELAKSNLVSTEGQEYPDLRNAAEESDGAEGVEPTVPADPAGAAASASHPERALTSSTPPLPALYLPVHVITLAHPAGRLFPALTISPHSIIALELSGSSSSPQRFIFVPTAPPPPPPAHLPAMDALAPVIMVPAPQGSASDLTPQGLSNEYISDYITKAKAQMETMCLQTESVLSLLDARLVQRDVLRLKKTPPSCSAGLEEDLALMGDGERRRCTLRRSQIFESSTGAQPKRSVLVLGSAGAGKTTLVRSLGLDWSRGALPQFDFFFLLDAKGLALTEPAFSLQTLLLGGLSAVSPPCPDTDRVFGCVVAAPERVLVVFDGFQETWFLEPLLQALEKGLVSDLLKDRGRRAFTARQVYAALLQRVLLPGCTLLVAARPRGATGNLSRWSDRLLEVCGLGPAEVHEALSRHFTGAAGRAAALSRLGGSPYLSSLCWNPALLRLVCLVLEHCDNSEPLPDTLSGLCRRALTLKLAAAAAEERDVTNGGGERQSCLKHVEAEKVKNTAGSRSCAGRAAATRGKSKRKKTKSNDRRDEEDLEAGLSRLAWEGLRLNALVLPPGQGVTAAVREAGLRAALFHSFRLRGGAHGVEGGGGGGGGRQAAQMESEEDEKGPAGQEGGKRESEDRKPAAGEMQTEEGLEDRSDGGGRVLVWSDPFLQSFLAGLHISSRRRTSGILRAFPMQVGDAVPGRRRVQKEELDLVRRFTVGTLLLRGPGASTSCDAASRRAPLVGYLEERLGRAGRSGARLLEVCHCVYETCGGGGEDAAGGRALLADVLAKIPREMSFQGVRLWPSDAYAVRKVLQLAGATDGGAGFSLGLEGTGIRTSGILTLLGLRNLVTFGACTADVISLWKELQEQQDEGNLKDLMSKFKLNPKATRVCQVHDLACLVRMHRTLTDSSSQSGSILGCGVPAVKELRSLELELAPEDCAAALPTLWSLLPGLTNLRHLDLDKSELGDAGAESLADVLRSLPHLEVLNLSQNGIGDRGVYKLSLVLMTPASLRCLSLYGNIISDTGAQRLAAVLPQMLSLTDLDVKYNNLTDVGAQSLGAALKKCPSVKSLRMWNKCVSFGVFERLQQQDSRIVCH